MTEILNHFADSIDISRTRVISSPSLIFLCGGRVSRQEGEFCSCRDVFYKSSSLRESSIAPKIVLAEDVFTYFEHTSYPDLLSFERDLAELSALTVVFPESAGSIAELGSFAILEGVSRRLLVVMHEKHSEKETFIWQGPIKYLREIAKKGKKDPILIYRWNDGDDGAYDGQSFPDAEALVEELEGILTDIPKTSSFETNNLGHCMLLIMDLLSVLFLATIDDLYNILKKLKLNVNKVKIEQMLSLLLSLKYINKKLYGHKRYYINTKQDLWLNFAFTNDAKNRDLPRWKSDFLFYYEGHELDKYRAYKSYMRSIGSSGDGYESRPN
jgi:hypothetical protein